MNSDLNFNLLGIQNINTKDLNLHSFAEFEVYIA